MAPLFEVRNLRRDIADRSIITNISFTLEPGEIIFVRGPSGVGKSLLLRALACLDHPQGGTLLLHGSPPSHVGYPAWRTCVAHVPQSRPSSLRGTPAELYFQAQTFSAQRCRPRGDLPALVHALGLEQVVLNQQWGELSGGQAQRVSLALAVALGPRVLLLDEPTSACDPLSALRVERMLATCGAALVWVTHDPHQPSRLGGRVLELPLGNIIPLPPPPPPPPLPPPMQFAHHAPSSSAAAAAAAPDAVTPSLGVGVSGALVPGGMGGLGGCGSGGIDVRGSGGGGSGGGLSSGSQQHLMLLGPGTGSGGSSLPLLSSPPLLPASRRAELLAGYIDGDGEGESYGGGGAGVLYGSGGGGGYPDALSDSSLLSPPSPSQLRGPRGVP